MHEHVLRASQVNREIFILISTKSLGFRVPNVFGAKYAPLILGTCVRLAHLSFRTDKPDRQSIFYIRDGSTNT